MVDTAALATLQSEGFDRTTAEKVWRLVDVLRSLEDNRKTAGKLTLKGGTALNIFRLPRIPRLSVDIDLMTTGFPDATPKSHSRREAVNLVRNIASERRYRVEERPSDSIVTLRLGYENELGRPDQIKIDLDFHNRMTLLPAESLSPPPDLESTDVVFPVVAASELLGQKLVAVAYRATPRDLFDMHEMLGQDWHLKLRARECYLAYSFLKDSTWQRLGYPILLDPDGLRPPYSEESLSDMLRRGEHAPTLDEIRGRATRALGESQPPFTHATPAELWLRDSVLEGHLEAFAKIAGEPEHEAAARLAQHSGLLWRVRNPNRPDSERRT